MDIITENKLLRRNFVLQEENDKLIEKIEMLESKLASRGQILSEMAYTASDLMASWERHKMFDHDMAEHTRGQLYAYETMFSRMQKLSKRDPDILQIISNPVAQYESWRDYVHGELASMNEKHQTEQEKKRKQRNDLAT